MPDRNDALELLDAWVDSPGLKNHMFAVEAAVRHYARLREADDDLWGLAGLLHDLDWEKYPEEHPHRGVARLREDGYSEEVIRAVLAHGYPDLTDVPPETDLDKVLCACDELSGLVYACCLVRPNGIDDLKPRSVAKKLKDKSFAAGVHRDEVARGVELIGIPRPDHIQNVIDGLKTAADVLEIRGEDLAARRKAN
jgi:predicted hydrolase (HD superfamily)